MTDVEIVYAFPDLSLLPSVFAYWEVALTGDAPVVDLLHPEAATIRMALSGSWGFGDAAESRPTAPGSIHLHGTTSKAQWVRGQGGRAFCIALKPFAWAQLLRKPAWHFSDRFVPLADVVAVRADELAGAVSSATDFEGRVKAANHILTRWQSAPPTLIDPELVLKLDAALSDPELATVEDLVGRMDLSQARLARLARQSHGFTPKYLIRRARFLRMLHIMEARPYAEWRDYIDTQYVDQSHMIRDFKNFLGLAPSHYFALERPLLQAAFEGIRRLVEQSN